ncbi:HD domain-containing protein [Candidatus Woesearchaeota archaeon]|nr:HD domain-containing protein [Candidatus Woesearchaeota archaeon]
MVDIDALLVPYKAKLVERVGRTGDRHESMAEHVFSSLLLARTLEKRINRKLDVHRAESLILYHDLVEIKSGDAFVLDDEARAGKVEREKEAVQELAKELPAEIRDEVLSCFGEYVANESWEAKFAHAVDALDPILHSFEDHPAWKKYGFTVAKLREKKLAAIEPFPELVELFEELIRIQEERGVIPDK